MNFRRVACAAALALATIASSGAVASAGAAPDTYLLALGDSLAIGQQPAHADTPAGPTSEGYADQLYATLKQNNPTLKLVKLGCSGETTTTMINGGKCDYAEGNQLAAAGAFLLNHPGQVKYVTNDIGANDVQKCAAAGSIDIACAISGFTTMSENLPVIAAGIAGALKVDNAFNGNKTSFVGMNYYNPFAASYLNGFGGVFTAALTTLLTYAVNSVQEKVYEAVGAPVADVAGAFQSYDFFTFKDLTDAGAVPAPVYQVCTLTYMCSTSKDIHANAAGYKVIADAFAAKLDLAPVS